MDLQASAPMSTSANCIAFDCAECANDISFEVTFIAN